ncbi:radical SAM protein [Mycoplasmatota bacterium]|nr:radical SAM protein [Mycoplasmatota bacterium]
MFTKLLSIATTRSFKPFKFKNNYSNNLEYENLDSLGLYVHIPFCKSICSFCPYSKQLMDEEVSLQYKEALLKEIELVTLNQIEKKDVTSLYFGGGTPSLMIKHIEDIINKLKEHFNILGGIGLELHPEDINDYILTKLKKIGITMISIGFQSFDNELLANIGRKEDKFIEKLKLVDRYNFDVVDVDLIFALPGQTQEMLTSDFKKAFTYGATQVSTYPFIDFTFVNNIKKPLSSKMKKKMLKHLNDLTEIMELDRTSVWTFSKKGTEKYSSVTRDNFLGFGTSATTLLRKSFKINTFSIDGYIERIKNDNLPTSLTLDFSLRQRAVYFLFWSSYGLKINENTYFNLIGKKLNNMYSFEMLVARILGYIKKTNYGYVLTSKGALVYHDIEQKYTHAYIDKMWNISRVVPFPNEIELL